MQHQRYIETAREIIETATSNEDLYRRLKGLAMDFAGDFPGAANDDIGRKIWFDGEYSVFLDAGGMGARSSAERAAFHRGRRAAAAEDAPRLRRMDRSRSRRRSARRQVPPHPLGDHLMTGGAPAC